MCTPLVGSTFGHSASTCKDAWLADPGDADSILMNIEKAWNAEDIIISQYN